jgi:hypothetical protein
MNDEEFRMAAQIEVFKNSLDHHSNLSTALIGFVQSMLRVALLLNGGAVIAALSVYGAKTTVTPPVWALGFWVAGLVLSAIAGFSAARSQREFQVVASHNFRQQGRDFFKLDFPDQSGAVQASAMQGYSWRNWFWRLWIGSIAAFAAGATAALYAMS